MIALALGLVLAVQQARGPEVMLAVDRDRVAPGDVLTLTIRVTSDLSDPIRVDLPTLGGVEVRAGGGTVGRGPLMVLLARALLVPGRPGRLWALLGPRPAAAPLGPEVGPEVRPEVKIDPAMRPSRALLSSSRTATARICGP